MTDTDKKMMECRLKFRVIRDAGKASAKRRKYVVELKEGFRYFMGLEKKSLKFGARAQDQCFGYYRLEEGSVVFYPEQGIGYDVTVDSKIDSSMVLRPGSVIEFLNYKIEILESPMAEHAHESPTLDVSSKAQEDGLEVLEPVEKTQVTPEARSPGPTVEDLKQEEHIVLEKIANEMKQKQESDESSIPKPIQEISLADYQPERGSASDSIGPTPTASFGLEPPANIIRGRKEIELDRAQVPTAPSIKLENPNVISEQIKPRLLNKTVTTPVPVRLSELIQTPSPFRAVLVTGLVASLVSIGGFLVQEWIQEGRPKDFRVIAKKIDEQTKLSEQIKTTLNKLTDAAPITHSRTPAAVIPETQVIDRLKMDRFFEASISGNAKQVELLLKSGGINPNYRSNDGNTALLYATQGNHLDTGLVLIHRGVDVNVQDPTGTTPLMWAVYRGNKDFVRLLLKSGAQKEIKRNDGVRAYDIAKLAKNVELMHLLSLDSPPQSKR